MENELAQKDIESLKIELSQLLRSHAGTDTTFSRQPGAADAAAAAVLGIGIGAGDKLLCFIKSVLVDVTKEITKPRKHQTSYGLSPILNRTCRTNHH